MDKELKQLIEGANRHNSDDMVELLSRFEPLLRKYERYLKYDGSYSDLTISFIELIYGMSPSSIENRNEGQLVMYIKRCVNNKSIDLYRKNHHLSEECGLPEDYDLEDPYPYYSTVYFKDIIRDLSPRQQAILKYKLYFGLSDIETGQILKISRQAVNRMYKRAIELLRKDFNK